MFHGTLSHGSWFWCSNPIFLINIIKRLTRIIIFWFKDKVVWLSSSSLWDNMAYNNINTWMRQKAGFRKRICDMHIGFGLNRFFPLYRQFDFRMVEKKYARICDTYTYTYHNQWSNDNTLGSDIFRTCYHFISMTHAYSIFALPHLLFMSRFHIWLAA